MDALNEILIDSQFLYERLHATTNGGAGQADEAELERFLDQLKRAISNTNEQPTLGKYLDWSGISHSKLRQALTTGILPNTVSGDWVVVLEEVLSGKRRIPPQLQPISGTPVPFQEILLSFVASFYRGMTGGGWSERITASARRDLARLLLRELSAVAGPTLFHEFNLFRARALDPLARAFVMGGIVESSEVYDDFIARMLQDNLASFLTKYSVLARLLAEITSQWTTACRSFVRDVEKDWTAISQVFFDGRSPGSVTCVQGDNSDPHHGHRTVLIVSFAKANKLVYKPRSLFMEQALSNFLAWLNTHDTSPVPFKTVASHDGTDHGWMEYISFEPSETEEGILQYYYQVGRLLAVLYVLGATDCHRENIIAVQEQPVLVDSETVLHPHVRVVDFDEYTDSAQFAAQDRLFRSILKTYLLPYWQVDEAKGVAFDVSGLGGGAGQDLPYIQPIWSSINTDGMSLEFKSGKLEAGANLPWVTEQAFTGRHAQQVKDGFDEMVRFLLEHGDAISLPGGPLQSFCGGRARFVFRNTNVYGALLRQLRAPHYLRDGRVFSIELEKLSRPFLQFDDPPPSWHLLAFERAALTRLDIPYFDVSVHEQALHVGEYLVDENFFLGPAFDQVQAQLSALSSETIAFQRYVLDVSLETLIPSSGTVNFHSAELTEAFSADQFADEADLLGRQIIADAVHGRDGSISWIVPKHFHELDVYQLSPVDLGLYEGVMGISLFLAALSRRDQAYCSYVHASVKPLLARLNSDRPSTRAFLQKGGVGMAVGLGGYIYALIRIGALLQDEELLLAALKVLPLLTPPLITADEQFDVISGSAGALLALIAGYRMLGNPSFRDTALLVGDHLLSNQQESGAWLTLSHRGLTGLSHGASGIALSLARLADLTGDEKYRRAAEAGLRYEDGSFNSELGGWADYRRDPGREYEQLQISWCHGASGIGLVRYLIAGRTKKVRFALDQTGDALRSMEQYADNICCGNMGRIDFVYTVAQGEGEPSRVELAKRTATRLVSLSKEGGGYWTMHALPRCYFKPTLFQGAAGIGYELLRLTGDQAYASILAFN